MNLKINLDLLFIKNQIIHVITLLINFLIFIFLNDNDNAK